MLQGAVSAPTLSSQVFSRCHLVYADEGNLEVVKWPEVAYLWSG